MSSFTTPSKPAPPSVQDHVLALAARKLTLAEVRQRVGGHGTDTLGVFFCGGRWAVSPEFGYAIERLVFSGQIRLERNPKGQLCVVPGRAYREAL